MYTVEESLFKDESGKEYTLFGIASEEISYKGLSSDKERVNNLCDACNRLNVSTFELPYIIDDFLNSKS